ncbi:hypothetical protein F0562_023593 [Nyssa sinensis]|uniref:Kinetochore protein SPC25 n=1 Tax=Nyssa sinensis TaxID=561372 RepID=A0A5J5BMD8_9ASTE|nr:hypothetical protein F0562_023593 [Nyssa sinensis]
MQSRVEQSVRAKMEELRLICDREIPIQQHRMDTAMVSFRKSLDSTKFKAEETVQNQAKLVELKAELREVEDDLVKALAVKTPIISQQSEALAACEEQQSKETVHTGEIEEAISWYNRVLGFRIECGHGVKFIFVNINLKNPNEEYFFTIRHENDMYTLLDCEPHLSNIKELINELNRKNGLFKFVRIMREKFQEAAAHGIFPQVSSLDQDSSTISVSAPVSPGSTDSRSESLAKQKERQPGETNRHSKKVNHGQGGKSAFVYPGTDSSLRRSPRFKVRR